MNFYDFISSSIGWVRFTGATISLAGFIVGLRIWWLWKNVHSGKGKMSFKLLRCFAGSHDYKTIDASEERSGPMIYTTYVSKCRRCFSERTETYDDPANYYY